MYRCYHSCIVYDANVIAMGSLYLASKVTEYGLRLREIIITYSILSGDEEYILVEEVCTYSCVLCRMHVRMF